MSQDVASVAAAGAPAAPAEGPAGARTTPSIAIVMPAFNEADRIEGTFEALATYLARTGSRIPLFLADDGSTDRTTGVAWAASERLGLDLEILRMPHRGKALTVRDAMLAVCGRVGADLVMMLDADNEIAIHQLEHVSWSADPRTVYIARRVAETHGALGATPPRTRRLMSAVMRLAARTLLRLPFSDTQCGFKLFPRSLAFELFSQQRSTDWVFDAEILVIAQGSGLPIREIPVVWQPRGESRVRTSAAVSSSAGLLRIAVRRWAGRYRRVGPPTPTGPSVAS